MNNFGLSIGISSVLFGAVSLVSILLYCVKFLMYEKNICLILKPAHNKDCYLKYAIEDGLEVVNQFKKEEILDAMRSNLLQ